MPTLVVLLLVVAIHLATNVTAWGSVGLLADDRFNVGFQVLVEKLPLLEQLRLIFLPDNLAVDQTAALYRPFISLTFLLEYPWFGIDALGYHVTNSALHCGTAMLWFGLVRRMSGSLVAATATAIAFAGWPGHSEVTHWISARTNLQSTFFMALALYLWDRAELCRTRKADTTISLLAIAAGVMALGSKETAVLVGPLALVVTWLRGTGLTTRQRLVRSMLRTLPFAAALLAWLWLRSTVLHTWGAGSGYSWPLEDRGVWDRGLTVLAWLASWLSLLMAPLHEEFSAGFLGPALWLLHGSLVVLALRGKEPGRRQTRWLAAAVLGLGLLAITGLPKNADTLENIRYSYEPALGLCTLLGLGIAALPLATRGPALGLLVVMHALALDGNREPWLRAGALHTRMEQQAHALAGEADGPIWVIDAPAVYQGAFVYLVENPTLFMPPFSPTEVAGRGRFERKIHERARAAARLPPLVPRRQRRDQHGRGLGRRHSYLTTRRYEG